VLVTARLPFVVVLVENRRNLGKKAAAFNV